MRIWVKELADLHISRICFIPLCPGRYSIKTGVSIILLEVLRCYGNASTPKRLNVEMPQKPVLRNFCFFGEIPQNWKMLRDFRIFLRRFLIFKVEVFPLFFEAFPLFLRHFRFLKKVLKLYFVEAFPLFFEAFPFFEKTFKTLFC